MRILIFLSIVVVLLIELTQNHKFQTIQHKPASVSHAPLTVEIMKVTELVKGTVTNASERVGVYEVKFDVWSHDSDIYVNALASPDNQKDSKGVSFRVKRQIGGEIAGILNSMLTATADKDCEDECFLVKAGETETFKLLVEYDPVEPGIYEFVITSLHYRIDDSDVEMIVDIPLRSAFDEAWLYI